MGRLLLATCASVAAVGHNWPGVQRLDGRFDSFVKAFGRQYSPVELEVRQETFLRNAKFVHVANLRNRSYRLGLNHFADLSHEEFVAKHLAHIGPEDNVSGSLLENEGDVGAAAAAPTPDSVDWRKDGAMTEVEDQGGCGACWAFAATSAISAAWKIKTGVLQALSEQQFIDCDTRNSKGCWGSTMVSAWEFATGVGLCSTASYPYMASQRHCRDGDGCALAIPRGGVRGFRLVRPSHEEALRLAVARQPVASGIDAADDNFRFYSSGVFDETEHCGHFPNHAVLVVGYGRQDGNTYWLVRNSWGSFWGEGGYFKLLRSASGRSGCGILTQPSYPVVRGRRGGMAATLPTGNRTHEYGPPPCLHGERTATVANATVCVQACDFPLRCPGEAAAGIKAVPDCVLKDRRNELYCALRCTSDSECGNEGAHCMMLSTVGVCAAPGTNGTNGSASTLELEDMAAVPEEPGTNGTNGSASTLEPEDMAAAPEEHAEGGPEQDTRAAGVPTRPPQPRRLAPSRAAVLV